jgi:glutathione S-transferase
MPVKVPGVKGTPRALSFRHEFFSCSMESSRSRPTPYDSTLTGMKLFRFSYSPYARKVQMVLDLLRVPHELVDVAYADRSALASLTNGYIYVPVLVGDDGVVTVESRRICEVLLDGASGEGLVPPPFEGPIWAYADFCDGPLEDVLFRLASPGIRDAWRDAGERALYTLIKERKFGTGCVDAWAADRRNLLARARTLLAPTLRTLERQPFLFGQHPTLADAALYGNLAMLQAAGTTLIEALSPSFEAYRERLETRARA